MFLINRDEKSSGRFLSVFSLVTRLFPLSLTNIANNKLHLILKSTFNRLIITSITWTCRPVVCLYLVAQGTRWWLVSQPLYKWWAFFFFFFFSFLYILNAYKNPTWYFPHIAKVSVSFSMESRHLCTEKKIKEQSCDGWFLHK